MSSCSATGAVLSPKSDLTRAQHQDHAQQGRFAEGKTLGKGDIYTLSLALIQKSVISEVTTGRCLCFRTHSSDLIRTCRTFNGTPSATDYASVRRGQSSSTLSIFPINVIISCAVKRKWHLNVSQAEQDGPEIFKGL